MTPFKEKLHKILYENNISINKFCADMGLDRASFFYKKIKGRRHGRHIYMGIAYYLGMDVEDLIDGTDAMDDYYER